MVKPFVSLSIDVQGVRGTVKNMGKLIDWANVKIPNLTVEEADEGARFAASIAPEKSGALIQGINWVASKGGATIVSRMPKGNPNWSGKIVPYQLFIHLGRYGRLQGRSINKTGDHRYMVTTAEKYMRKYPEDAAKSLSKTLKGFVNTK